MVIVISDGVHTILYVPWKGEESLPCGSSATTPPGPTHNYVCCHGTDMQPTSGILLEALVRPTSIQTTFSANNAEIPATVVYGSATHGDMNEQTLHVVADNSARRSKGRRCSMRPLTWHFITSVPVQCDVSLHDLGCVMDISSCTSGPWCKITSTIEQTY